MVLTKATRRRLKVGAAIGGLAAGFVGLFGYAARLGAGGTSTAVTTVAAVGVSVLGVAALVAGGLVAAAALVGFLFPTPAGSAATRAELVDGDLADELVDGRDVLRVGVGR